MRRTSWLAVVIVVVVGSAIGIVGGNFLAWLESVPGGLSNWVSPPLGGKTRARILMIGEDDTAKGAKNGKGLSDTLVVFAFNTNTKQIRAISIPRDTRVEIAGYGTCKINAAHVYGGPELTRSVVSDLLGVNIDYYIKTNTAGLRGMVDLLGGVYIKIDRNMRYTDRRGGLHINLRASPDKQLLNGRQAEGYVRFRHDRIGDCGWESVDGKQVPAGRVVRQQYFLRALANRVLALPSNRERAEFLRTCYERKYIVSDLILRDWQELAELFKDMKPELIHAEVMPGTLQSIHGGSYVVPDEDKLAEAVDRTLLFRQLAAEEASKVEVLNGCGAAGIAQRVADRLEQAGFKVARTGNAPSFDYDESCIITHTGKTHGVQRIAALLGCDDIREDTNRSSQADVTVIIGRNHSD